MARLHYLGLNNGRVDGLRRLVTAFRYHFDVIERVEEDAHNDLLGAVVSRLGVDEAHQPMNSGTQLMDALPLFLLQLPSSARRFVFEPELPLAA